MNKLYFRAWLKDEERLVYAESIEFSTPINGRFREVNIWDEYGEYHEGFIGNQLDIMQGIEIGGKVVYEGDIVEYGAPYIKGYRKVRIFDLEDLLCLWWGSKRFNYIKVLGNVYENGDLIWEKECGSKSLKKKKE